MFILISYLCALFPTPPPRLILVGRVFCQLCWIVLLISVGRQWCGGCPVVLPWTTLLTRCLYRAPRTVDLATGHTGGLFIADRLAFLRQDQLTAFARAALLHMHFDLHAAHCGCVTWLYVLVAVARFVRTAVPFAFFLRAVHVLPDVPCARCAAYTLLPYSHFAFGVCTPYYLPRGLFAVRRVAAPHTCTVCCRTRALRTHRALPRSGLDGTNAASFLARLVLRGMVRRLGAAWWFVDHLWVSVSLLIYGTIAFHCSASRRAVKRSTDSHVKITTLFVI